MHPKALSIKIYMLSHNFALKQCRPGKHAGDQAPELNSCLLSEALMEFAQLLCHCRCPLMSRTIH